MFNKKFNNESLLKAHLEDAHHRVSGEGVCLYYQNLTIYWEHKNQRTKKVNLHKALELMVQLNVSICALYERSKFYRAFAIIFCNNDSTTDIKLTPTLVYND